MIARSQRGGGSRVPGQVDLPPDSLLIELSASTAIVRIHVTHMSLQREGGQIRVASAAGTMREQPFARGIRLMKDETSYAAGT